MVRRARAWAALVVVFAVAIAPLARSAPPSAPDAAALATAKREFERGLKLYKERAFREALAAFEAAKKSAPRASIQQNIAQCQRDLQDFPAAYDAYEELLAQYGSTMKPADVATVKRALDDLAQLTGTIRVAVAEPDAAVQLDGKDLGRTPLAKAVRVKLGPHRIVVAKSGFETLTKDVDVAPRVDVLVDAPLEKEITTGRVSITVTPASASVRVFVDGEDRGAPPLEIDLAPGAHDIEARGASASAATKRIDVVRKQKLAVALDAQSTVGRVQIDAHQHDADITVDGKAMGKGVWEGALAPGRHELTVTSRGFEVHRRAFLVHAGETYVADVRLDAVGGVREQPTYVGLYSTLDFFGVASPSDATTGITDACPSSPCRTSSPLGAGLGVRVGYAFGWFGIEGLVLGMYDHADATVTYPSDVTTSPSGNVGVARTDDFTFHRFGGAGALGARVMSKHPNVRFTLGASFGVERKGNIYKRESRGAVADSTGKNPTATFTSDTVSYTAPMFVFDAGIWVGSANGPKFHLGALALVELVGDPVLAAGDSTRTLGNAPLGTPPLQIASGTQFFVGPVIGLHFGQ